MKNKVSVYVTLYILGQEETARIIGQRVHLGCLGPYYPAYWRKHAKSIAAKQWPQGNKRLIAKKIRAYMVLLDKAEEVIIKLRRK